MAFPGRGRQAPPPPPRDTSFLPTLEVVKGQGSTPSFRLAQLTVRIGRGPDNELVLKDDAVSRNHATVRFEDGSWHVDDLGSRNGVLVNNVRVPSAVLKHGDRLLLGDTELAFTEAAQQIPQDTRVKLLERWDLLAPLAAEAKASLAAAMTPRAVPGDGVIFKPNTVIDRVLFVHTGTVDLVEINDAGGQRLLARLGPGDLYGERALLPGQTEPCMLVAESPACLLELPQAALHEILRAKPESSQTVFVSVREKLKSSQIQLPKAAPERPERPDALSHLAPSTDVVILGEDKRVVAAKKKVETLASQRRTPLLVGQEGTGKRTFARYFHKSGPNPGDPYLEVSLAEVEPGAIEATLFGVEADPRVPKATGRTGYLEMLSTGTLVIAHAELLDTHVQVKLLTYLKLGWFHRLYGQQSVTSKTRVVLVANGAEADVLARLIPELKEELRDNVIALPPLAQRLKDIPVLAEHFMKVHARKAGKRIGSISREAVDKLVSYAWPGNVTELENVIQRAAIVTAEAELIPGDLIFVTPPEKEFHKQNLLKNEKLRAVLRHPRLFPAITAVNMAFVAAVAVLTLYGSTRPPGHPLAVAETNPGMLVTWLVWFPLLPFSAALIGRVWCGICPIAGFGDLVARFGRLNLPVPRIFKSLGFWGLVVAYLTVEYMEGAVEIDDSAKATGFFLLIVVLLAVVFTVIWERRAFCKHLCPLAPWLSAYATMAPLEVRGNKKVCQTQCGEHTCYKGTETVPGCPMFLYPASMSSNADCLLCTNCVRSCENRGVQLNLRPPLQELWRNTQPALPVSLFSVMMIGLMFNHQFTHITFWKGIKATLTIPKGLYKPSMWLGAMALALLAFALAAVLSAAASQEKVRDNLARYGIGFVPLAFAAHAAIMAEEVLGDGIARIWFYVKQLWGAVFRGLPITAEGVELAPFMHPAVLTFVKFLIVTGGVTGTLVALLMIARQGAPQNAFGRALPHLLLLVFFSALAFWIFTASTGSLPPPSAALGTATVAPPG